MTATIASSIQIRPSAGVPLPDGQEVLVIDDVLLDPEGLVDWARGQSFYPPIGFPYPGIGTGAPAEPGRSLCRLLRAARALAPASAPHRLKHDVRLSMMVTTPPHQLAPCQWQCHRDQVTANPDHHLRRVGALPVPRPRPRRHQLLRAASVPCGDRPHPALESQTLSPEVFGARYGLTPGYHGWRQRIFRPRGARTCRVEPDDPVRRRLLPYR